MYFFFPFFLYGQTIVVILPFLLTNFEFFLDLNSISAPSCFPLSSQKCIRCLDFGFILLCNCLCFSIKC
jgi:hypothetical protein